MALVTKSIALNDFLFASLPTIKRGFDVQTRSEVERNFLAQSTSRLRYAT
jgi:hypothetical protein